ncbi:BspA family leucine-rich repeat surface protein [Enterococcus faecium]|uniref:BspA family leucine-rich repeat surface protein n=1 Tax=Enterococcus faecium TaxID=1352 RepID=UPI0023E8BA85|nr:BspA family leucine-rich repeat surface protein [Enterococcus faecium]MDF3826012.1 BspA family leucine-rich repeat surface protein [Enterococcus faecium]
MISQKYKYIVLSSVILGTIGLSVTSVNIEALDDKKEQGNNTILNNNSSTNGVENKFSERSFSINSIDSESNNLSNNSNSRVNVGNTVIKGRQERIGDWEVQWWGDGGYDYCELLEYKGSSLNIDLDTGMGNRADNVILDTSNLKKIIPNYKNIESINLGRFGYGALQPSKVQNNKVTAVTNIDFSGFSSLKSVILNKIDTSRVTSLSNMFADCSSLVSVNLGSINTGNVSSFRDMFARCNSLQSIDLSNINTDKATDMQGVFYHCPNLRNINVSTWNTSNVTNFQGMFDGCSQLSSLNIKNFNTSKATTLKDMFYGCTQLKILDLSSFVLNENVNDSGMFTTLGKTELLVLTNDTKLKNLDYNARFNRVPLNGPILDANGGRFSGNQVTKNYFEKCAYEPNKIELTEFEKFKNENQPTLEGKYRFTEWQPSKEINSAKTVLDLLDVTYIAQYHHTEWNYQWDSSDNYYTLTEYIGTDRNIVVPNEICGKPTKINLSSAFPLKNLGGSSPWTNVTSVRFSNNNGKKVKAIGNKIWFNSWSNMTEFDGSGLDTSNINDLEKTFENCSKLNRINISGWNTSNVTTMFDMFAKCSSLETIDIKNWNTSQLTNMQGIFYQCTNLKNIDLSSWNTEHVTNMIGTFNQCSNLNSVNIKNFNTKKVNSMQDMFRKCDNLKIIDLSSFVLNNNTDTNGMFYTSTDMELLVLTTDNTLKTLNYQDKFNRIPLHGPILDANGGKFSDNTVIKKYFDRCAYEPNKIELTEFEKFKNDNQPNNNGFAHDLLDWQKEGTGSDNPSTVLDILENTYKAKWGNINWEFEENESRVLLKKYIGESNEVVVPSNSNGKKVVLQDINTSIIPKRVTKFSVEQSQNYKVGIVDNDLNFAFDGNNNLQEIDLRGLDTSNIIKMEVMFRNCTNLKKANFSNIDMSKVTAMDYNFQNCQKLTDVDFSNTNASALSNTCRMFTGCKKLKIIDLRSFQLTNDAKCSNMFFVDDPSELLVLTNDIKIQSLNYKTDNRIPLDGVKLDGNGGFFSDKQKIKKYFEKCAYPPQKIELAELEKFKKENIPTRSEFATTFVNWIPEHDEPKEVKNVLDLGDIIYKAKWEDPNWEFFENEDKIILTKYKGNSNEITINAVLDGKNVEISDINNAVIPERITKFLLKEKNNQKVKVQDNSLYQAFLNNKNIIEVDLSGLESTNIINMEQLFKGCSNLVRVTLNGLDTHNVTNFKSMFYDCSKLSDVDISTLNTENVIDMSYLFYNCYALENIDLSGWDTAKVQWMGRMFHNTKISSLDIRHFKTPSLVSTNRMFNGCSKLKVIRMDNFDMSKVTDSTAMFYRGKGTETLVVTKDHQLLTTYRFNSDNTHPLTKPALNANGGSFENSQEVKYYFEKVAVLPEDLQLAKFEEFKNTNIPTKSNSVFRRWEETTSSKSSNEGVLDLLDKSYMAKWKNMICNTTVDNKKLNTVGDIGFVYLPEHFLTTETKLQDEGEQRIRFNKKQSLNIGVRDLSQSKSYWSVSGQLNWLRKEIPGAYIQIESNKDSIKKNINDNVNDFDSSHDLVDANEEVSTAPSNDGYLKITSSSVNRLIEANTDKTHDDIYDYNLGNASLVIPDTKYVQEGEHTATVEWNLTNAPQ